MAHTTSEIKSVGAQAAHLEVRRYTLKTSITCSPVYSENGETRIGAFFTSSPLP